jgi:hypothetical protein
LCYFSFELTHFEVSPDPRDTHYVVVQLQDNPDIEKGSANIAGKHFKNSTLIQMDKDSGYRIVSFELTHSRALSIHQNHPMDFLTAHCGF